MEHWTAEVLSELDERDATERWKHERNLRRDSIIQSKGDALWNALLDGARRGVEELKRKRSDLTGLSFEEENCERFTVRQSRYPAVTVKVSKTQRGIDLQYLTCRSTDDSFISEPKCVQFSVDDDDNLIMSCREQRLMTKDELSSFILGPVLGLQR